LFGRRELANRSPRDAAATLALNAKNTWPALQQSLQCGGVLEPLLVGAEPAMPGKIEGTVVAYSESGNLVTDIPNDRLRDVPRSDSVTVTCDEHQTVGIYAADHSEEPFTLMAILGPGGALEITIVGESAKGMLGVKLGEKVVVKW
jgi:S-adenosylmethionine hydrolase